MKWLNNFILIIFCILCPIILFNGLMRVCAKEKSIKCNVNLMYDNAYYECILNNDKTLGLSVEVSNKDLITDSLKCYIAEYDSENKLLKITQGKKIDISSNNISIVNINKKFTRKTSKAKILLWCANNLQPIANAVILDKTQKDYYSDTFENANTYNINHCINGAINSTDDIDYFKFIPEVSGEYELDCISAVDIKCALYDLNKNILNENFITCKYNLIAGETYYVKAVGNIGEYVLSIRNILQDMPKPFDIYKFDADTNIYKDSINSICRDLYKVNETMSVQMYNEYESILDDDAKLHMLPDFLLNYPKDLDNYDELINQYFGTMCNDFIKIKQRYINLIDKYDELSRNNTATSIESNSYNNFCKYVYPINGKIKTNKMNDEFIIDNMDFNSDVMSALNTPSLTIVSKTPTSFTYSVTFPVSGADGNEIQLIDFNADNGLTTEKNLYGSDTNRRNGQYIVTGLSPNGMYVISMLWKNKNDDNDVYYDSINRIVLLPDNKPEKLISYKGNRIIAQMESADKLLASTSDFNKWMERMDMVYEAYKELTGYTPFNSKKITMQSTRDNLNDYMDIEDGKDYWKIVVGYFNYNPVFKYSRPFFRGHMRRLAYNDWGDITIHELSHVFDNNWEFDMETMAVLKAYYIMEQLNATVYRQDQNDNDNMGWYTGAEYYDFIKRDWFTSGYDDSFNKGEYSSEGFAAILIDIQKQIGWEPFKKTFRYFNSLTNATTPVEEYDILKLFLTKLKDYSGDDVLSYICSRDMEIIEQKFGVELSYAEQEYPRIFEYDSNEGTTIEADEGAYSVYRFLPSTSANYYVYTTPYGESGVSNDTYIEVYDNAELSGIPIVSNDDYDGGRFSKVSFAATRGKVYYIKVRHYANGKLHAELNITKNAPVQPLTLDEYQDIITSSGEFSLLSYTPQNDGAYVFNVEDINNGSGGYGTYIKLYENISMTKRMGSDNKKIVANLRAGHKYYIKFSGYLMEKTKGRITVSQAQTLQFTKRSDSSFIYVNSPEYITRFDIVDDVSHIQPVLDKTVAQPYMKLSEFENITGKNTFYETHTAWWGELVQDGNATYNYNPLQQFYLDIDMYNPTSSPITVSIENLAYGVSYSDLQQYYNGGYNYEFTIQPQEHVPIFSYINAPLLCCEKDAGTWARIPAILFDFTVHSGNVTVSTIAAYDKGNLYLRNGTKNIVNNTGAELDSGEVLFGTDINGGKINPRPNETDLYGKIKGIAKNESAWIDSDIEVIIDDNTELGTPIPLVLKDSYYTYGIANPKWSWKSSINPLNDAWDGVLTMLPNGLHNFKYHYKDTSRQWYFDFQHRDLRYCNINGNGPSVNDSVPSDIIDNAKRDMAAGRKEHFADDEAPDEYAMSVGEWGATYHYTVTVKNTTSELRTTYVKTWSAENMIFGLKRQGETTYSTDYYAKIYNTPNAPANTAIVNIPANSTTSFEFVTLLGGGLGGLNHSIVIE